MSTVITLPRVRSRLISTTAMSRVRERTDFHGRTTQHPFTRGFGVLGDCNRSLSRFDPTPHCPYHRRDSSWPY